MILATVCVALHLLHTWLLYHIHLLLLWIFTPLMWHHIKPVSILHTVWSDSISNNSMFYVNCNCIIHGHIKVNLWLVSFILIGQYLNDLQDILFWWKGKCTIWLYSLIIQMMILVIKINFYNTLYCFLDRKN